MTKKPSKIKKKRLRGLNSQSTDHQSALVAINLESQLQVGHTEKLSPSHT